MWGRSETGRRRKYYRPTRVGVEHLDRQRRRWQLVDKAMRGVWRMAADPIWQPV